MTHRLVGMFVTAALLATSSSALADQDNTITITQLENNGEGVRFFVRAQGNVSCSFSTGGSLISLPEAAIVNTIGVGVDADTRREAVTLLTSAFLAGKKVTLTLRRSDTGGTHCRIMKVRVDS